VTIVTYKVRKGDLASSQLRVSKMVESVEQYLPLNIIWNLT